VEKFADSDANSESVTTLIVSIVSEMYRHIDRVLNHIKPRVMDMIVAMPCPSPLLIT